MFLENPQQYVGKKYNSTTIIEYIGKYRDNTYAYVCKCDCGKEFRIRLREKDKVRPCCASCQSKIANLHLKPKIYEYCGEKIFLKDLAKKLNIKYGTLSSRIYVLKWNKDRWGEPIKRGNK